MENLDERQAARFINAGGAVVLVCSEPTCGAHLRKIDPEQVVDCNRPYFCKTHAAYTAEEAVYYAEEPAELV